MQGGKRRGQLKGPLSKAHDLLPNTFLPSNSRSTSSCFTTRLSNLKRNISWAYLLQIVSIGEIS